MEASDPDVNSGQICSLTESGVRNVMKVATRADCKSFLSYILNQSALLIVLFADTTLRAPKNLTTTKKEIIEFMPYLS